MIFRKQLIAKVLTGAKTQTRRPATDDDCRYVVGRIYGVQADRGKKAVTRIRVTDVRRERLGDISADDARREGFSTTWHFFDYWRSIYGERRDDDTVWVITFELSDEEPPRLLAKRFGYTDKPALALPDEPEAVDGETLERYAAQNRARFCGDDHHAEDRRRVERLRNAAAAARRRGLALEELRVIDAQIEQLERRIHGTAA